jgi:cephalosporin hydroxylase
MFYNGDEVNFANLFKNHIVNDEDVEKIVETACNIGILQSRDELKYMCYLLTILKPKIILEIGMYNGGTLTAWALVSKLMGESPILIGIDSGIQAGQVGDVLKRNILTNLYINGINIDNAHILTMDSHSEMCVNKVKEILGDNKIDFCFIDGDHTYEGVKQDYDNYSQFTRHGGIIGFHDIINIKTHVGQYQVERFWNEIKVGKTYGEITNIYPKEWDCSGIGVIYKDPIDITKASHGDFYEVK